MEGLGPLVQDLVAYFYADSGLVASTLMDKFQRYFEILEDLFVWFGIQTNVWKTVIMDGHPCHTPGGMSKVLYEI